MINLGKTWIGSENVAVENKYKVIERRHRHDVVTNDEKEYMQISFWKNNIKGLEDAKTWAEWVCEQLNKDVEK